MKCITYTLHCFLPFLSLIKYVLHHTASLPVFLPSPSPFSSLCVVKYVPFWVISSRKHCKNNFMSIAREGDRSQLWKIFFFFYMVNPAWDNLSKARKRWSSPTMGVPPAVAEVGKLKVRDLLLFTLWRPFTYCIWRGKGPLTILILLFYETMFVLRGISLKWDEDGTINWFEKGD